MLCYARKNMLTTNPTIVYFYDVPIKIHGKKYKNKNITHLYYLDINSSHFGIFYYFVHVYTIHIFKKKKHTVQTILKSVLHLVIKGKTFPSYSNTS